MESLENRLEKMEGLLRRLMPDVDLARELDLSSNVTNVHSAQWQPPQSASPSGPSTQLAIKAIRQWDTSPEFSQPQNIEDAEHLELADNLRNLRVDAREYRFFGKSSGAMLIKTAIDLKQEFTGRDTNMKPVVLGERRPEFWRPLPVCAPLHNELLADRQCQWEDSMSGSCNPGYTFPEPDLLAKLIHVYFKDVNVFFPLLHRPTFERSLREELHYRDDMFAAVVLLICAVASRFVDDRRVLLDGVDSWHSCGWKYFDQVQVVRKSLLAPPSLLDLQFYCVRVPIQRLAVIISIHQSAFSSISARVLCTSFVLDDGWSRNSASSRRGCTSEKANETFDGGR